MKYERLFYSGDFPALEGEFVARVKHLRESDPLSPLVVVVTSRLLGLHLARLLAESDVPYINIHFLTIEDLADRIALPAVLAENRARMPGFASRSVMSEALHLAVSETEDFYFSSILDSPGFHSAVLATVRDLEEGVFTPDDLDRAARDPGLTGKLHVKKVADLARIWKRYNTVLDDMGWIDTNQVIERAVNLLPATRLVAEACSVLVYGFYDLNALQKRFLEACTALRPTIFFIPFEPCRAFAFAEPVVKWVESQGFVGRPAPPGAAPDGSPALAHLRSHIFETMGEFPGYEDTVTIISAPGEAREIREIARYVLGESKEDVRSHEVGILLRDPGSYGGLVRDTFERLGMQPYLPEGRPLSDTVDGRAVILLLEVIAQGYARKEVMEFITFAGLKPETLGDGTGKVLPVHRWDAASVAAGIVEGANEWHERLGKLLTELSCSRPMDSNEAIHPKAHPFDSDDVATLMRFMENLVRSLDAIRKATTWSKKSLLLIRTLRDMTEGTDTGARVADAITRLGELDRLGSQPTQAEFQYAVAEILGGETIRTGRFQRQGPTVVSVEAARGLPFKTVIIPGMAEKVFPPVARQDAILLDHEREALNGFVAGKGAGTLHLRSLTRIEEERLLFRLAIGAARTKLVLTFPRIATGTAKERLPSSFLLATAEAMSGHRVYFDTVEEIPGLVRVPLVRIAAPPETAIDAVEFDLSTALGSLEESVPERLLYMRRNSHFFAGALRLEASRWGEPFFTVYDGVMAGGAARRFLKRDYAIIDRRVSPTRLEVYAGCPFAYLLGVIMGIESPEEPEHARTISPYDKGRLVHSILWKFMTALTQGGCGTARLRPEDGPLLRDIAVRSFHEFEETGVVGFPMMWEMEMEEMLGYFREFIEDESAREDMDPTYFEVRYGMGRYTDEESEISTDEPVPFEFDGRRVYLRGKIDRIDLSADEGRARVIDYKTGRARAKPDDFQGGRTLQLPLYLAAARHILRGIRPEIDDLRAEYYHLAEQSGTKRHIGFSAECLEAKRPELNYIIATIADGIEGGIFFPVPGDTCRWCTFKAVCGADSRRLYERKRGDPRAAAFLRMRGETSEDTSTEEAGQ